MALTGKIALLASLTFIGSMSWLVSQVARPIVEQRTPLVARGQESRQAEAHASADKTRRPVTQPSEGAIKNQFQHTSSLADANRASQGNTDVLVMAAEDVPVLDRELPPMYVPEEPIVARVEPAASPIEDEPLEPLYVEAVYATANESAASEERAAVRPTMLMALRPEETTGVGIGWEMADTTPAAPLQQYTVQPGDSLQKITKRLWNRTDAEAVKLIVAANPDLAKRKDRIFAGEVLNVPDPSNPRPAPVAANGKSAKEKASIKEKGSDVRWYTVQKQDSLAGIAKRQLNDPNRWREIAELNGMRDANRIVPGLKIKLPPVRTDT